MGNDVSYLWGRRIELIVSLNGVLVLSMLILDKDGQQKNPPDEITDWIKGHYSTFENWPKMLGDIHHPNTSGLTADQLCQSMIDVLEGLEPVVSEGSKLFKCTSLEGEEKVLFDSLVTLLQKIYQRYSLLQDF